MKVKDKEVTDIVIMVNGSPVHVGAGVLVLNGVQYDVFTTTTTTTTTTTEPPPSTINVQYSTSNITTPVTIPFYNVAVGEPQPYSVTDETGQGTYVMIDFPQTVSYTVQGAVMGDGSGTGSQATFVVGSAQDVEVRFESDGIYFNRHFHLV